MVLRQQAKLLQPGEQQEPGGHAAFAWSRNSGYHRQNTLLIFLHPLRCHQLPESPPWLVIVGLHEAEAFGRWNCILFSTPKRHDTPASDHLEKASLWAARR